MSGDNIKSEFPPDAKPYIPAELKQEVEKVVRDLVSEMTQSNSKSKSNIALSFEAERSTLKDTIATLETELACTKKQVHDAWIVINGFRSKLEQQAASHAADVRGFEQQFAALSEREAALRLDTTQLRADRDAAVEAEKRIAFAKDQIAAHNVHLSTKLSEMQDQYAFKVAQLNDTVHAHNQLQERLFQVTEENKYWRNYYAASTSTSDNRPPPAIYFNVPQMPSRRATVPDVSSAVPRYAPFYQAAAEGPRGQKRPRVDSVSDAAAPAPIAVAPQQASPTSPAAFKLRPVRPANPVHAHSAISPSAIGPQPGPSAVHFAPGVSGVPCAPVAAPRPTASAPPTPTSPVAAESELAPQQQPTPQASPSSAPQTPSIGDSAKEAIAASQPLPGQIQQILKQLFPVSAAGQRECKLCKTRPDGVPRIASSDTVECLAHAEKYHKKVLTLLKSRLAGQA